MLNLDLASRKDNEQSQYKLFNSILVMIDNMRRFWALTRRESKIISTVLIVSVLVIFIFYFVRYEVAPQILENPCKSAYFKGNIREDIPDSHFKVPLDVIMVNSENTTLGYSEEDI